MKQLFTLILTLLSFGSFAQPAANANKEQKIQALYIAYISKELKLTEDEAQKFWPVHSQYDAEIKAANNSTDELARQQAQLNIKKKYQDRFSKILGPQRTNDFYVKDGEFRKKMIDRLRQLRQQKQGMNKGRKDKVEPDA
ncbi:MAG: hypothetical protein EOP53_05905 [Sphingobacteriales bacterium]|nr:MAG: hypothetical protein EOP53_05905 [Sphingobacteriales bacterium]